MKRYLLSIGILFFMLTAPRQVKAQYYSDLEGRPVRQYVPDAEGSLFLFDFWAPGFAVTDKGVTHKDMMLKYNMLEDMVVFKGANNEPMAFVEPIRKFNINTLVFVNGFPPIGGQSIKSYYQQLASGNIQLLKYKKKTIKETKGYGSTSNTRELVDEVSYYIFKNDAIRYIRLNKKDVLAEMQDKQAQIQSYLSSHQTNFKNDSDLAALFDYYNSLQ